MHTQESVNHCTSKYFQDKFTPAKYFSIDRVFRNETLDATHLAEFHQIEGVVADHDLTLGHLIGILYAFFKKLGQWILYIMCCGCRSVLGTDRKKWALYNLECFILPSLCKIMNANIFQYFIHNP